jgi:hypothetical protein
MRGNLLAVGVLLVLIGIALWYFPLQSGSLAPDHVPSGTKDIIQLSAPLDLLGSSVPFSLDWNASSSVTVDVYSCGTDSSCASAGSSSPVASGSGASGSLSWSGHRGQYFAVVPTGAPTTVAVSYTYPLYDGLPGIGIFVAGVIVVLLGVGLSRPPPPVKEVPAHFKTTATMEEEGHVVEPSEGPP